MGSEFETRIRHVTAVLGPTNTGKTHLAIERMLGHETGMIGLPLRLLAREVYDKIAARIGADKVALVTGEEKIKPERARYWVATVEAMPRDVDVDFLAIDEIQLCGDPERGHVFTDRLLHARGRAETLLLGAQTMREAILDLIPGANFISRPRLSKLTYAGEKKITRLPGRSAVVAFSANDVYSLAELMRRQRGGAAVVLGALSPRTRNAQVALFQSGDVDFIVATDAIGMGINLDVDHVAFAARRKFDGQNHRDLTPGELGQIAGRAGRHMNDGTFGVTAGVEPFDAELIDRLESHNFESVRLLQWRNRKIEFSSLDALRESLREMPREARLVRARMADDVLALETVSADREIVAHASTPAAVSTLWDVCQVPDYRKISSNNHAEMIATLYKFLMGPEGRIPEDWFAKQVAFADRTDGDIDTLANRIAHIRTWTFVSNRAAWLKDPTHWQSRTREIEDALSDALHERLTERFVDKRTSALMKGMRDKDELTADIAEDGAITVENHYVGRLKGFRFTPETHNETIHGKAARHAAAQVLSRELSMRARRVAAAKPDAFKITRNGRILWREEEIARLESGADALKPSVVLLADEHLSQPDREKVQTRLDTFIGEVVAERLKPLVELSKDQGISGLARGIAFRLAENLGVLKREAIAEEIKALDQTARSQLRKHGLRFGAFNLYFPLLMKPAASELAATLWALKHAGEHGLALDALPEPPRPGLTSVSASSQIPEALYRAQGFHLCGPRAVRLDILERLADQIRPLLAFRSSADNPVLPPKGSTGDGGFTVIPEMMSILGCSGAELGEVLKTLGFKLERRLVKPVVAPVPETAPTAEAPAAEVPASDAEAAQAPPEASPGIVPGEPAEATSEAPVTPPAAAEPVYEEVWRPRRGRHGESRPQHAERQRHRGRQERSASRPASVPAATPGEDGTGTTDEPQAKPDRDHPRGDRPRQGRRDDRDNRGRDRERGERPPQHGQQGRRNDDRDRRRGRDDRSRGRDERRPVDVVSAAPPRKTAIDPDSPFAALGALREALEKRTKDQGST